MTLLPRPWNRRAALAVLAAGLLTACGRRAEAVAPHSGKVEVGVVTAAPTDVPIDMLTKNIIAAKVRHASSSSGVFPRPG